MRKSLLVLLQGPPFAVAVLYPPAPVYSTLAGVSSVKTALQR